MENGKVNIKVVIGANYGDEGKGLMTDYFCRTMGESGVVVMSNGGAQRGHTVETVGGKRVVFHHFGSGYLAGWDTYCPECFIVNPAQFVQEDLRLSDLFRDRQYPKFIVHEGCRWSTPFDMILNQARLIKDNRENSCGMGVWETVKRYRSYEKENRLMPTLREFIQMTTQEKEAIMAILLAYFYKMLREYSIDTAMNQSMKNLFDFDPAGIIRHFIFDCDCMGRNVSFVKYNAEALMNRYTNIVFEGAQGLAIGGQLTEDIKNNTPTNTGLKEPLSVIETSFEGQDVEVCYVSRSYLTRHGLGPVENECDAGLINFDIRDKTNVFNPFQGHIRYGILNLETMLDRVDNDFEQAIESVCRVENRYHKVVAFTHMNEAEPDGFDDLVEYAFEHDIEGIYTSDGRTAQSVKKVMS